MPNSFLSLHILGDGCNEADITRSGEFLNRCGCEFYNITTAARYNEAEKLIRRIHDLAPNAKALWRGWHSDVLKDSDIWRKVKPQEWIDYRIKPNVQWLDELDVYTVTCNEVGVLGPDAKVWSAWEAACIRMAWEQYQVRLAVMRFSTGNPLETEYENYDTVLQAAGECRALLTPNQYPALNGELSTNHVVGRHKWMLQRQDKLGVQRSKVVIGEYALCYYNGKNEPDPNHGYDDMNVNIDQHLTILKRDGVLYQNEGTTACWFTFGHWQEGGGSFDIHHNEALLKAVESEAGQGVFDMHVKDIVLNQPYRLSMPGKIITAYVAPSVTDRVLGTIPDAAKIQLLGRVTISGETWLKISYQAFSGVCWIKGDLISLKQTIETPVVQANIDTKPLQETPSAPPAIETPPAKPDVSTNGKPPEVPPTAPNSASRDLTVYQNLKVIRGAFQTAMDALDSIIELYAPIKETI